MGDKELLGWCSLLAQRGDGRPFVVEVDGQRMLQFDGLTIQSQMALDDPDALALDYTRTMMGFLLLHPEPRHIAMIGLGGGSLVKYCLHTLPGVRVTAIEINPDVIALRDEFGIPPDGERLRVICADGADYVRERDDAPDVLLVDGFDLAGMPAALGSAGFYDDCRAMLADDGVLAVNLWSGDPRYGLYTSRIRASFDERVVVVRADEDSNRIAFASKDEFFPPVRAELLARARALAADHPFGMMPLAQRMQHRIESRRALPREALPRETRPSRRRQG